MKKFFVRGTVLMSLVAGMCLLLACNGKKAAEQADEYVDSVMAEMTDSVEPVEELEVVEEVVDSAALQFEAFAEKLRSIREPNDGYFVYDVNNDGELEVCVKTGTCEADYKLDIYAWRDGVVKKIVSVGAGHCNFGLYFGQFASYWCHMGGRGINNISFIGDNTKYREVASFNEYDEETGEFIEDFEQDPKYQEFEKKEKRFYPFEWASVKSTKPLKKAFNF